MKILHTADLHIGKILNEVNLLEDQRYILKEIENIAVKENIEAIIVSGDIYDRAIPPAEAVVVLDEWLVSVTQKGIKVLMISGNHDSSERLNFVSNILKYNGLFISTNLKFRKINEEINKYQTEIEKIELNNMVNIYLLPFIKPQIVKHYFPQKNILTFNDAIRTVLENLYLDKNKVNILVNHNFVIGKINGEEIVIEQSDSENKISIGGIDSVDISLFEDFDYVALGHIHRSQKAGKDNIRYSGSPIKYSFSEANHKKSVSIIEICDKNSNKKSIEIKEVELKPLRDLRIITGELGKILNGEILDEKSKDDYICAELTDEMDLIEPMAKIRTIYPNTMQIIIKKEFRDNYNETFEVAEKFSKKSTLELFEDFYFQMTGKELNDKQKDVINEISQNNGGEFN